MPDVRGVGVPVGAGSQGAMGRFTHEELLGLHAADYGEFATVTDLFRQISYDERVHKLDSLRRTGEPRFR